MSKIQDLPVKYDYTGNGSTTNFQFNSMFWNTSDIVVYKNGERVLSGYEIQSSDNNSATVVFSTAPENGAKITLYRSLTAARLTEYMESGTFRADPTNDEFNHILGLIQQLREALGRCPQFGIESLKVDLTIADPQAGHAIVWNEAGTGLKNSEYVFDAAVDDVTAKAAAAAASATSAASSATTATNKATAAAASETAAAASATAAEAAKTYAQNAVTDENLIAVATDLADEDSYIKAAMPNATAAAASATAAAGSATSAASSATTAPNKAPAAATSETNAASSATAAAASATAAAAAKAYAEAAITDENLIAVATDLADEDSYIKAAGENATAAAASATAAANSATAAGVSATNASNSASQAATAKLQAQSSATNASNSANAAALSATSAGTSASTATTKATAAAASASNAATSATNASNSANAASSSATNAASSATAAAGSATSAASSASTATTKATAAAASETNAASSATAAAGSASSASDSATAAANSAGIAGEIEHKILSNDNVKVVAENILRVNAVAEVADGIGKLSNDANISSIRTMADTITQYNADIIGGVAYTSEFGETISGGVNDTAEWEETLCGGVVDTVYDNVFENDMKKIAGNINELKYVADNGEQIIADTALVEQDTAIVVSNTEEFSQRFDSEEFQNVANAASDINTLAGSLGLVETVIHYLQYIGKIIHGGVATTSEWGDTVCGGVVDTAEWDTAVHGGLADTVF